MQTSVTLSKQTTRSDRKTYRYWVLRWFASDGRRRSQHLGKTTEMSRRQAEKKRREKEAELGANPGRRDVSRSPALGPFLEQYYANRRTELGPDTLELHRQTGRYLVGYFGGQRRLDSISRADARAFKTALAGGELAHVNRRRRQKDLAPTTVDQHIRHARTIFNHALHDDLITFNPFDRLGQTDPVEKDWHYVGNEEFGKLTAAARPGWRLLFGLARWAGLRLEEALELPWRKIDWKKRRLTVISRDESAAEGGFTVKDKDARVVPICPELFALLEAAYDPQAELVIPPGGVVYQNVWRDFQVVAKRAGVAPYSKPLHSLRKSCVTDWAARFPAHVVKEWAGHADIRTTLKYYLKVSESEYDRAAGLGALQAGDKPSETDFDRATRLPATIPGPEREDET
jgi:integrase